MGDRKQDVGRREEERLGSRKAHLQGTGAERGPERRESLGVPAEVGALGIRTEGCGHSPAQCGEEALVAVALLDVEIPIPVEIKVGDAPPRLTYAPL